MPPASEPIVNGQLGGTPNITSSMMTSTYVSSARPRIRWRLPCLDHRAGLVVLVLIKHCHRRQFGEFPPNIVTRTEVYGGRQAC
jgi:hypothetical protein